jgi:endoribonuclease LACTB2
MPKGASSPRQPLTIVNVGYRSTNYWVLAAGRERLLVDLGWPGRVGALTKELDRHGVPLAEIRYGLATHYHIDHAGAAEDLKQLGMTLVVVDLQQPWIDAMAQWVKPEDRYTPITHAGNRIVSIANSRDWLGEIGLSGQLVHTPGHSDDSVSLLLDSGELFTGDLTLEALATEDQAAVVRESWNTLRALGAKTVYPGHGRIHPVPAPPIE